MTTIAVVFQSERGHTKALAEAVLKGIMQVPGVEGQLLEISSKEVMEGRYRNDEMMKQLDVFGWNRFRLCHLHGKRVRRVQGVPGSGIPPTLVRAALER